MEEEKNITNETTSNETTETETTANEATATETAASTEAAVMAEEPTPKETSDKNTSDDKLMRKILFSLCYIWGILFFLPILVYKNDEEAKLHANQGLALLLLAIGGNVLFGLLTMIAPLHTLFSVIAGVYSAALLVLGIMGIINVVTESDRKLPIISNFNLIK